MAYDEHNRDIQVKDVPEKKKPGEKGRSVAIILGVVLTAVALGVMLFLAEKSNNQQNMKHNLVNHCYYYVEEGIRKEYDFRAVNQCIYREYDLNGYESKLLKEETYEFSIKSQGKDIWQLEIGNGKDFEFQAEQNSVPTGLTYYSNYYRGGQPLQKEERPTVPLQEYLSDYRNSLLGDGSLTSYGIEDADYISAAKSFLSENLKHPSTAVVNTELVYEKDSYGRAIVFLDVTAQNGFGNYIREEYYICICEIDSLGGYKYSTYFPYCNDLFSLDALKEMNDFGKHPEESTYEDYLLDTPANYENVTAPNGTTLSSKVCRAEKMRVFLYTDPNLEDHVAGLYLQWLGKPWMEQGDEERVIMEQVIATAIRKMNPEYDVNEDLIELLCSSVTVTKYVRGGYIIRSENKEDYFAITVFDGVRYGVKKPENVSTTVNGSEMEEETPKSNATEVGSSTNLEAFAEIVDFSKVWKYEFDWYGWPETIYYVFSEDGTCHVVLSSGGSPWSGGKGTYVIDGNTISFEIRIEDCSFEYSYEFDPKTGILTYISGLPIYHELQTKDIKLLLEEDDVNSIDKIKNIAQSYIDSHVPDEYL